KIALSLPPERMWSPLSGAGFGAPLKSGFPGEVSGRLRPAKSWRPIEQATIAYGHGISVNLVQLARAYTIFATDGELKPVSLLKTAGDVAGQRVISAETARALRRMMERAVAPGGTAPKAQVRGYRVAGKTSTAPGDAFAAYPGEARDGRSYVPDALSRGAGSVLWDDAGWTWPAALRAPNAGVTNLKHELGWIADRVYAQPSAALWMAGITGT